MSQSCLTPDVTAYHDYLHSDTKAGGISKRYRCCIYMPFTLLESSTQLGNCAIIFLPPFVLHCN